MRRCGILYAFGGCERRCDRAKGHSGPCSGDLRPEVTPCEWSEGFTLRFLPANSAFVWTFGDAVIPVRLNDAESPLFFANEGEAVSEARFQGYTVKRRGASGLYHAFAPGMEPRAFVVPQVPQGA